ncbi:MAG: low molecular weight phosphatase family protein [Nanoarchaeota archaeon]
MKLLFVCKANVGRSQIAEAFYEKYSLNPNVKSAGYAPEEWEGKNLDTAQHVKVCMDEEGINVRKKISKKLNKEMADWADKIIVFDSKKQDWPAFLRESGRVEIWEIEDPRYSDLDAHRKIRDAIKGKVEILLKEIK